MRTYDNGMTLADRELMRCIRKCEMCYYCKRRTIPSKRTVDHKTPISRGGWHTEENMVMACIECNRRKANMTEDEFAASTPCGDTRVCLKMLNNPERSES